MMLENTLKNFSIKIFLTMIRYDTIWNYLYFIINLMFVPSPTIIVFFLLSKITTDFKFTYVNN